jgi:hypothetical protein
VAFPGPYDAKTIGAPAAPDAGGVSVVSEKVAPASKSTVSPGWSRARLTRAIVRHA